MKGKKYFSKAEAEQIVELIKQKLKADTTKQKGIRNKIRNRGFYASDFRLAGGYTVQDFLRVVTITDQANLQELSTVNSQKIKPQEKPSQAKRDESDEAYIINLCDEVLKQKAERQHRFDFLRGDSGTKLPVDAYYSKLNLVIEFMEKQHTEAVKFFDRKQTVSGVGRGEQRRIYDARRKELIPKNGIDLVILDYSEFEHTKAKKLIRNKEKDRKVIIKKLKKYLIN